MWDLIGMFYNSENKTLMRFRVGRNYILKCINIRRDVARQDDERILLLRYQDDETLSIGPGWLHLLSREFNC